MKWYGCGSRKPNINSSGSIWWITQLSLEEVALSSVTDSVVVILLSTSCSVGCSSTSRSGSPGVRSS